MRARAWCGLVVTAVVTLAGCTASPPAGVDSTVTSTRTVTRAPITLTPDPPAPFAPAAQDAPAEPPGDPLPAGQVERTCPYIRAGLNIEPESSGTNFADLEGSRVQRVTVLTGLKPVGCRFYWFNDFHPTGDIMPSTYASPTDAHNAMVVTAEAGTEALGVKNFVPGVDGVSFRTRMNAADDGQDWAFVFAKGDVMVVIRTDQTDVSINARLIAEAVVGRF